MNEQTITNADYRTSRREYDLAIYDPPFDIWKEIDWKVNAKTFVCFTNFNNRHHVEKLFGVPKFEMIWHFKDGRWVSHKMPRLTYEHILIYGELKNEAYTGELNEDTTPQKKGSGSVGRTKMSSRMYVPRNRKMLNSVIEVPRNVGKQLGVWSKPINLARPIMHWLTSTGDRVWDGFAGSGTFGVVAKELNLHYEGFEIDMITAEDGNNRIENYESLL